jgi:mycothiol system anti-sigma-R factor
LSEIDCSQVLIEIEAYVDREVEVARYEQIEGHLGVCPPCMDRAEFRAKLKELLSAKCCSEEVPADLLARIREVLAQASDA